jgi:transcription elongation GreA/GreB family factor
VAAAQSSLPEDTLYPTKILSEKIEDALTVQSDKKLDLAVDRSEERLNEIARLLTNGTVPDDDIIENLKQALEKTLKLYSETGKTDTTDIDGLLSDLQEELEKIQNESDDTSSTEETSLNRTLAMIQDLIKLLEEKLTVLPDSSDTQQLAPRPEMQPEQMPTRLPDQNQVKRPNPARQPESSERLNPGPGSNFDPGNGNPMMPAHGTN